MNRMIKKDDTFENSDSYWKNRYAKGGNSGDGSYCQLAAFKAEVINDLIHKFEVNSVVELGCGDGNQLGLFRCKEYTGYDISEDALNLCRSKHSECLDKRFINFIDFDDSVYDMSMSLDVVYHLIEDDVYEDYMHKLFACSKSVVVVYSSNTEFTPSYYSAHVKNRAFSKWIEANKPNWSLVTHIPNRYEYKGDSKNGSHADFYVFAKKRVIE